MLPHVNCEYFSFLKRNSVIKAVKIVGFFTQLPVHLQFSQFYKRMSVWFHNWKAQAQKATHCLYLVKKCIFVEE